uniref:G-protein coupled receptors family 1 profile domain-containing protein n=1 Tax=Latimeria chalumnae TaxID=7897 RepID=H2ZZJ5_LATCH
TNSSVLIYSWSRRTMENLVRIVSVIPFITVFLSMNILMLYVFFSGTSFQENSRYVLFAHMLVNDTLQLAVAVLLLWITELHAKIPLPVCHFLVALTGSAYLITPLNLAAMSLERYVAICVPLRHAEICQVGRTWIVIATMWFLGTSPFLADFVLLCVLQRRNFFLLSLDCTREEIIFTSAQSFLRSLAHGLDFSVVALIILYTYVKIWLTARRMRANKSSATRARKTVILHAFQLGLCMVSFTYPITENLLLGQKNWFYVNLTFLNFVVFILFPRFLSPLIYGLRDETFKSHLRRFLPCWSVSIGPAFSK